MSEQSVAATNSQSPSQPPYMHPHPSPRLSDESVSSQQVYTRYGSAALPSFRNQFDEKLTHTPTKWLPFTHTTQHTPNVPTVIAHNYTSSPSPTHKCSSNSVLTSLMSPVLNCSSFSNTPVSSCARVPIVSTSIHMHEPIASANASAKHHHQNIEHSSHINVCARKRSRHVLEPQLELEHSHSQSLSTSTPLQTSLHQLSTSSDCDCDCDSNQLRCQTKLTDDFISPPSTVRVPDVVTGYNNPIHVIFPSFPTRKQTILHNAHSNRKQRKINKQIKRHKIEWHK
jgi:hypothetical protein